MLLLKELYHYPWKRVTIHRTVLLVPACNYWLVRCCYIRTVLQLQNGAIKTTAQSGKSLLPILSLSHANKWQVKRVQ
jgi:hypothetical protein